MDRMLEAYTERFIDRNFVDTARLYQSARVDRAQYVGSAIGAGVATLSRAVKNLAGSFAAWRARRQAENELAQLDDRMLAPQVVDDFLPGVSVELATEGVLCWAEIFGLISFELFGHLVGSVADNEAFFEAGVNEMVSRLGLG